MVRGLCMAAVVLIHSGSAANMQSVPGQEWQFWYWLFLRQVINFAVGTFFFLSGCLVDQEKVRRAPAKFIGSRLLRLAVPFLLWSSVYSIKTVVLDWPEVDPLSLLLHFVAGKTAAPFYFGAAAAERAYACFAVGAGDKSRQNHCLVYHAGLSGGAGRLLHPQRQPAVAVRNGLSCLADLLLGRASLAKRRKAHGAFGVSAGGARFLLPQCSAARCSAAFAGLGAQPGAAGNSPLRSSACHVVRRAPLPVGRKKVLEISGR